MEGMRVLFHADLVGWMRRGLRNGNWRRLSPVERALFRAATCYAKPKGKIVNPTVIERLKAIIEKIKESRFVRALRIGISVAERMLCQYKETFRWCPRMRDWLQDHKYILWLGQTELSTRGSQLT